MNLEIGPLNPYQPSARPRPAAPAAEREFSLDAARDTAQLSLPAFPPPEVQDEIGAAADRVDELRAQNRELHFRTDEETGRVIIEVRDLEGTVIRTIPPADVLEVMAGAGV